MVTELLLVTYEFPFGGSETFLETEIQYIAESFSTVWVVPSRAVWSPREFEKKRNLERKVPQKVKVLVPSVKESTPVSLGDSFSIFLRAQFWRGPIKLLPKRIYYSLREGYKAALLSRFIQIRLPLPGRSIYGYAYWMVESSVALGWLKELRIIDGYITRGHRGDLYDEEHPAGRKLYNQFLFETCDRMMPISEHGAAYLRRSGCRPDRIMVSRLGVRLGPLATRKYDTERLHIVSCSNLIPVKRVALLAQALQSARFPFEWHHFGDGVEREQITNLIEGFPQCGRGVLHGWTPNHEVISYYRNNPVDVFVNISISEGVPVSIMEAMAAGVPVLATAVCGTPELVDDLCGELLEPELTCEDLAMALEGVWSNRLQWVERGHVARSRAEALCDGAKNYRDFSMQVIQLAKKPFNTSVSA